MTRARGIARSSRRFEGGLRTLHMRLVLRERLPCARVLSTFLDDGLGRSQSADATGVGRYRRHVELDDDRGHGAVRSELVEVLDARLARDLRADPWLR